MSKKELNPALRQTDVSGSAFNGWIKLNGIAGEMEDCDCWLLREDGKIFLSPKGEFIGIGEYSFYQPIRKPTILPDGF